MGFYNYDQVFEVEYQDAFQGSLWKITKNYINFLSYN